ncbi:MAG: helix-turn-helix domain-containing protein [Acidobacteriota bacterium]|jgi:transcriptional regulator with XRE-family HTH domain
MSAFDRLDRALTLLRTRSGFKQIEVAQRAGITPSMISEYESGKKRPHVDTLEKMLAVLGADAHGLANALRTAQREGVEEQLRREAESGDGAESEARARLRATAALGEMTTAFDTLTRSVEDLLLGGSGPFGGDEP